MIWTIQGLELKALRFYEDLKATDDMNNSKSSIVGFGAMNNSSRRWH